jgi:predicted amidophosphoribosyltransferase
LSLRVAPLALERTVATERQASLNAAARQENTAGAFVARRPGGLTGRAVILVDDVVTTGATARACIDALRTAGARPVGLSCIAST